MYIYYKMTKSNKQSTLKNKATLKNTATIKRKYMGNKRRSRKNRKVNNLKKNKKSKRKRRSIRQKRQKQSGGADSGDTVETFSFGDIIPQNQLKRRSLFSSLSGSSIKSKEETETETETKKTRSERIKAMVDYLSELNQTQSEIKGISIPKPKFPDNTKTKYFSGAINPTEITIRGLNEPIKSGNYGYFNYNQFTESAEYISQTELYINYGDSKYEITKINTDNNTNNINSLMILHTFQHRTSRSTLVKMLIDGNNLQEFANLNKDLQITKTTTNGIVTFEITKSEQV